VHSYHPLHPSPAGKESPTLYVSLPNLHPQVGQHSSSPAGTTTPPGKSQEGVSQSTSCEWSRAMQIITKINSSIMECRMYVNGNLCYILQTTLTAQSVAFIHTCPQPLEQHFIPGPQSMPTAQSSTQIPNPVGVGHTTECMNTHGKTTKIRHTICNQSICMHNALGTIYCILTLIICAITTITMLYKLPNWDGNCHNYKLPHASSNLCTKFSIHYHHTITFI